MSRFKSALLVTALAATAMTAGVAQARYYPALCDVSVSSTGDGSGFMVATAAPGLSGYFELEAFQIRPTGTMDLSQSGPFRANGFGQTVLTRNFLSTSYTGAPAWGPERPRGVGYANEQWNDGRYGRDVSVAATLRVYDNRGRLICSDEVSDLAPATYRPQSRSRSRVPFGH
ncbi:hypothetical protein V0U79_05230 [Hyphobacterium sp. HN65]|uniref:Uncharacterized protein n=1 Tax=Hyphobacterium lacteum TaxID=3116575 RepID=A0ABU7LPB6_9PROT|nr:hypothetical protein [Hyphobacterium sp. HN65]MEE2525761.1 hypothetical protein [Hyphobacterium sp. HN65]